MAPPQRSRARAPTSDVGCHNRTGPLRNKPEAGRWPAELAHQAIQGRWRVDNPTIFPDLTAEAALGYRHDDPLLVNIKTDIRDTISHDRSPMHEARHRPIRRNSRYLHTERRVAPSLGGHVVFCNGPLVSSPSLTHHAAGLGLLFVVPPLHAIKQ